MNVKGRCNSDFVNLCKMGCTCYLECVCMYVYMYVCMQYVCMCNMIGKKS